MPLSPLLLQEVIERDRELQARLDAAGYVEPGSPAWMKAETEAARRVVLALYAQAGLPVPRRSERGLVRAVREYARQKAEDDGTRIFDEINAAAALLVCGARISAALRRRRA